MPTSLPSATSSFSVSPSPMSRSDAWSSAARLMMRSSASRLMSSWPPPILDLGLVAGRRRRQRLARAGGQSGRAAPDRLEQPLEEVNGDREDRRRVLLGGDLGHRLQIAQLDGRGLGTDDAGRHRQLLGSLQLAFGVDDLGAPLTLRLRLP